MAGGAASGSALLSARPMSRDKSDTLLLLAACLLVLAPHAAHLPWWISALCGALLLWRAWITFRGNRMPPRRLLLSLAAASMVAVYAYYGTPFGRDTGVAMLVLLLTFKLLEMRARRDLFVVLFLSFFLILANFFYSQSIATTLLMGAAVLALLTAQHSFQYAQAIPSLRQRAKFSLVLLGLALPLTLVLFVLFPRIQGPLWSMPNDSRSARSGLSDSMAPGSISSLTLSAEIAFRVKFEGEPPPAASLYWRGPVLGSYDGRDWTALPPQALAFESRSVQALGPAVRYQVTLEPNDRRSLFALELPQAAPFIEGTPVRLAPDFQLLSRRPIQQRLRYQAVSHPQYQLQADASAQSLRNWKALPAAANPRTRDLARQLREQSSDPRELIASVLRQFREQDFHYTLTPPLLGTHAVDDFLFSTRSGFCEHYAGAFVFLMRALDIPARVVTGYQGGEVNPVDGYLTVRQSNAHAWTEVWLQGQGWVRIDPTAAVAPTRVQSSQGAVPPPALLGGLVNLSASPDTWLARLQTVRQRWEALNNRWNQWVLDYTPARQRNLLESLGLVNVDWRTLALLMFGAGLLAMGAVALPLLNWRQRPAPLDAVYLDLCARLERAGHPRDRHEGPRSYAERLRRSAPDLPAHKLAAATRFLALYEQARYGRPEGAQHAQTQDAKTQRSRQQAILAELKALSRSFR